MTLPPKKEKKIIKERRKGIKLKFDDPHPSCLDPFVDHTDFDTQILLICSSQNNTSLNWIWMVSIFATKLATWRPFKHT